jgi:hypothetical protein
MQLFNLRIHSIAGKIFVNALTHSLIKDIYTGVNAEGMIYENNTQKDNIVVLESAKDNCVVIAVYGDKNIQKWFIETDNHQALAYKLVNNLGVLCENGEYDQKLFD